MMNVQMPLRDTIYNDVVDAIINGRINAGEKLSERDLAKRFNVSRTPVREALLQLEKTGYVVHIKNIGAVVKKLTARGFEEIMHVVGVLEGHSVELFAGHPLEPANISHLKNLNAQMEHCARTRKYGEYVEINKTFHAFFGAECGNATLHELINDLRMRAYNTVVLGFTLPVHIEEYLVCHKQIIGAVIDKKPEEAAHLMKNHVWEVSAYTAETMRQMNYG